MSRVPLQLELPRPPLRLQVLAGPQPQATPVPFAKSCHFATSPPGDCLLLEEWTEVLSGHRSLSRSFLEVPDWSRDGHCSQPCNRQEPEEDLRLHQMMGHQETLLRPPQAAGAV